MSDTNRTRPASITGTRSQDNAICLQLFWVDRYCGPNRSAANDPAIPQAPRPSRS